jgi:hypothetical protein
MTIRVALMLVLLAAPALAAEVTIDCAKATPQAQANQRRRTAARSSSRG